MNREDFKDKLSGLDIDYLINVFCKFYNVNRICLDLIDMCNKDELKKYIIDNMINDYETFTQEELFEIVGE